MSFFSFSSTLGMKINCIGGSIKGYKPPNKTTPRKKRNRTDGLPHTASAAVTPAACTDNKDGRQGLLQGEQNGDDGKAYETRGLRSRLEESQNLCCPRLDGLCGIPIIESFNHCFRVSRFLSCKG